MIFFSKSKTRVVLVQNKTNLFFQLLNSFKPLFYALRCATNESEKHKLALNFNIFDLLFFSFNFLFLSMKKRQVLCYLIKTLNSMAKTSLVNICETSFTLGMRAECGPWRLLILPGKSR